MSIEEVKRKVDALQTKIKFQAFGKIKPATAKAKSRRLEIRKKASTGLDDEDAKKLLSYQSVIIEEEINKLKAENTVVSQMCSRCKK